MHRRSLALTLAAVAVTIGLAAPQLAGSAPGGDPRAEREQVRAEAAEVAARIDTSKASLSEIDAALRALEDNVRTQQAALARTEEQVARAEQDLADAEAAIVALTDEVAALKVTIRERAVQAYVSPPGDDVLTVLGTKDFTSASSRKFYIELRAQSDADIADRLEGASADLAYQKKQATEAKAEAEAKRAEQEQRTDAVAAAEAKQQQLADNLEAQIDSQIQRSLELAKTDRALSAEIAREQAEIAARIAAQQSKERATADQARIRRAAMATNVTPDGKETAPTGGGGGGGGATVTPGGAEAGVSIAYVQGVPVNAAVAQQVSAMINAAAADGVSLRIGNSYRSIPQQIILRRQNCGTSDYAIYHMPASACSPDTAIPGRSQHQLGLAIDFANCGSSSPCFRWLRANAVRFGYYNLPSESWHWSTTGN